MKTLIALLVALVAFTLPVSAQAQYLRSDVAIVEYQTGEPMPFEACTLPPSTPVRVEVLADARYWYTLLNKGPAIAGYIYGRTVEIKMEGPAGNAGTQTVYNQVCSGALAQWQTTESLLELTQLPLGQVEAITTVAQLPTHVSYRVWGEMREWTGIGTPVILGQRRPWEMAHRTWFSTTLCVTPL